MPSWTRRWASWLRFTRVCTWCLTSARPTSDSSCSRGPWAALACSAPPVPADATFAGRVSPQASSAPLPVLFRSCTPSRSLTRVCRRPAPRLSRTVQSVAVTGSELSTRTPSPTLTLNWQPVREARPPLDTRMPCAAQSVTWVRSAESSPPLSTTRPEALPDSTRQSRSAPMPAGPTDTPASAASRTTVSRTSGLLARGDPQARAAGLVDLAVLKAPAPVLDDLHAVSARRGDPGPAQQRIGRRADPDAGCPPDPLSAVSRTPPPTRPPAAPRSPCRRSPAPWFRSGTASWSRRPGWRARRLPSNTQSRNVPRDRSVTASPLPLVRAVRQPSSSGSAPEPSRMPGPEVSLTETSSRTGREPLVT